MELIWGFLYGEPAQIMKSVDVNGKGLSRAALLRETAFNLPQYYIFTTMDETLLVCF